MSFDTEKIYNITITLIIFKNMKIKVYEINNGHI